MNKRYSLIIIIICITDFSLSQDFKFIWHLSPSFNYTVKIEKKDNKSYIFVKETRSNDSITKKISKNDCDSLTSFLDKYDFPERGSTIYGPMVREYVETKLLPDTNWIQVKGDSIRREIMWIRGYNFDSDSGKCYTEKQMVNSWTDGNTYEGEYVKSNIKRTFSVYCTRISVKDFELNKMIYNLIIKYDHKKDYRPLKILIYTDIPRVKS